jgi:acyl-CoA dehydrogenase
VLAAEPIEAKIRAAEKNGLFKAEPLANVRDIGKLAADRGIITAEESAVLKRRDELRDRVIHVDDFPFQIHAASADTTVVHSAAASLHARAA